MRGKKVERMGNGQDLQFRYSELIKEFKQFCLKLGWKEDFSEWSNFLEGIAIFNTDLESVDIKDIKYIVVADNPGQNERNNAKYLFDNNDDHRCSGYIAHRIFEKIFTDGSYIVLNKCPLYTDESDDLNSENIDKNRRDESMRYMAKLIFDIDNLKPDIHVYVFGINGLFDNKKNKIKNGLWTPFFDELIELYKNSEDFPTLAKHFSHHCIFDDFILSDEGEIILSDEGEIQIKPRLKIDDLNAGNAAGFLRELGNLPYSDNLRHWEHVKKRNG